MTHPRQVVCEDLFYAAQVGAGAVLASTILCIRVPLGFLALDVRPAWGQNLYP